MQNNFVGTWSLEASYNQAGEFEILDDIEEYRRVYRKWLLEEGTINFAAFNKAAGLKLTLESNETFTELKTGDPQILWYDADGVEADVTPFCGNYIIISNRAFLTLPNSLSGSRQIRYDDGDTKICDSLRLVDEHLIRTISVITDELYTQRVFICYRRS